MIDRYLVELYAQTNSAFNLVNTDALLAYFLGTWVRACCGGPDVDIFQYVLLC